MTYSAYYITLKKPSCQGKRSRSVRLFISIKLVLIFLLTLTSCKKYTLDYWPVVYPPEVEYQINLFLDYAPPGIKTKPLTIILTDKIYYKGNRVLGLTSISDKTIYLDTTSMSWKYSRTTLVLHELGHYVLNRDHLNDTTTILDTWHGYPASFMYFETGKPSDWNLKRTDLLDYYMEELFSLYYVEG